jgi:signal transduction histidine kinase
MWFEQLRFSRSLLFFRNHTMRFMVRMARWKPRFPLVILVSIFLSIYLRAAQATQLDHDSRGAAADANPQRSPAELIQQLHRNARLLSEDQALCAELCTSTIQEAEHRHAAAVAATALMQRSCALMDRYGLQAGKVDFQKALESFPSEASDEVRLLFVQARSFHDRHFYKSQGIFTPSALKIELALVSSTLDESLRLSAHLDLLSYLIEDLPVDEQSFAAARGLLVDSTHAEHLFRFQFLTLKNRSLGNEPVSVLLPIVRNLVRHPNFTQCSRRFRAEALIFCGQLLSSEANRDQAIVCFQEAQGLAKKLLDQTLLAEADIHYAAQFPIEERVTLMPQIAEDSENWVSAINNISLLRHGVEVFVFVTADRAASTMHGQLARQAVRRIDVLKAYHLDMSAKLSQAVSSGTDVLVARQTEYQTQIANQQADSESTGRWIQILYRSGIGVFGLMAAFLLRDRWRLRRMNRQLQREISNSAAQRLEKEKIELRLAQTERLESLGLLAGGIAHDFNNLLVGVLGNAELLKCVEPTDKRAGSYIDRIIKSADTAAQLSRKMLVYAGKEPATRKVVNLNESISRLLPVLRSGTGSRELLDFEPCPEPLLTEADSAQLDQMLMNLVNNAAQATSENRGRIVVRTGACELPEISAEPGTFGNRKTGGEFVWFEVRDEGSGILEQHLGRVFEPFFSTKQNAAGHGFGLAVVYGHVNRHDGLIQLSSTPGQGSCFRILLPKTHLLLPAQPEERPQIPPVESAKRHAIVAVDDQRCVLDFVSDALSSESTVVHTFTTATDALEFFAEHQDVDCLLLDLIMPGLDGGAMLEEMTVRNISVPAIVMSGFSTVNLNEFLRFPGVKAVLQKPFRPNELISTVQSVISKDVRSQVTVPPLQDSSL